MKVMKSQTMMISVQCQAQFSQEILTKYSWSFSQGNHVRLLHKEEAVHAKQQAPITVPNVTIQQIIQPLYIRLAMQHLSFSQIAVYKQQLLRETNESIVRLQASNGANASTHQHTQTTRIVHAPPAVAETEIASAKSAVSDAAQAKSILQNNQVNTTWLQMKQVSQHFKQDRFLQSIMEKRDVVTHHYEHVKQMDHVVTKAQAFEIEKVVLSESHNRESLAREKSTASIARDIEHDNENLRNSEVNPSKVIIRSQAKQPARMVWHERVEERQQQWRKEQEAILLNTQTIVKQLESTNEHSTEQVVRTTVQRLVHRDLLQYMSAQHMKVSTTQLVQLKKISMKQVAQKTLNQIEQRLSQEHIKLYYAAEQMRQKSYPKKENNQLAQDRQAVVHHIKQNRQIATVLKIVNVQADSFSPQATHIQNTAQTIQITNPSQQQLVHSAINRIEESRKQVERPLVKLPLVKEQRIISVSEQWLNRTKTKEQLTLIHLTKRVSEITRTRNDEQKTSSERLSSERLNSVRLSSEKLGIDKQSNEKLSSDKQSGEKLISDASREMLSNDKPTTEKLSTDHNDSLSKEKPSSAVQSSDSAAASEGSSRQGEPISRSSSSNIVTTGLEEQALQRPSAEVIWIVNDRLQAKVETVHLHSLQHSITKHIKQVLPQAVQGALHSRTREDEKEPVLQAKWQHKQAAQQTVLLNKLQERLRHRVVDDEVITVQHQQSVTIHTQTRQQVTLTNGKSISLSSLSHRWGAAIQKLAPKSIIVRKLLSERELTYHESQEAKAIPVLARKLLREVTTHNISTETISTHTSTAQSSETKKEEKVYYANRSIVTRQHNAQIVHEHRIFKPIVRQLMTTLHKEHDKLPTALKRVQLAEQRMVEHSKSLSADKRQVERSGTIPVSMKQVEHSVSSSVEVRQDDQSMPLRIQQANRARTRPLDLRIAERSNTLPVVIKQTDITRSNSEIVTRLNHVDTSKPLKAETVRKENTAQTLSLKRVELDTVIKHVSLLVKEEKKVKQQESLAEPIAVMQTHIKKLEEQIIQQQQLIQDAKNPSAIKQLSNQIYEELSRKIKFENQRLGR